MTTRKKLNANKKLQKPITEEVGLEESLEKDDLLLLEDDGDDFDFTVLDLDDELASDQSDDDLDFDEDESDDDDLDFDEDESDDDDLDINDDESIDDEPEEDDIFADTTELENDPFAFNVSLRKAALPVAKKMVVTATKVDYKNISAAESKHGNAYQTFSITCDVNHPITKEVVTIKEFGTNTNVRFIKIVTALNNGTIPKSLSKIIGKKAIVTIIHKTDDLGNVWDNIDTIEPYNPLPKKKSK